MTPVDIESFDAVTVCNAGFEFELKGTDGITGCGVIVTVFGKHSDRVSKWFNAEINKNTMAFEMAKKKGKTVEPKSMEEQSEKNIEATVIRVAGWSNVSTEYTAEAMARALRRNPHWIEQIVNESENLGNFTARPSAS